MSVSAEMLFFFFLGALAVTTAVMMIVQRNPVMSAICLIGNFFALAGLYLLLHAQFLAVLQIIVYTGAIMVLVVFVIMLLNLADERNLVDRMNIRTTFGIILSAGLLLELAVIVFTRSYPAMPRPIPTVAGAMGTVEGMGAALFGPFLLPFEITSLLLLVAIVGAVILAKKRL